MHLDEWYHGDNKPSNLFMCRFVCSSSCVAYTYSEIMKNTSILNKLKRCWNDSTFLHVVRYDLTLVNLHGKYKCYEIFLHAHMTYTV